MKAPIHALKEIELVKVVKKDAKTAELQQCVHVITDLAHVRVGEKKKWRQEKREKESKCKTSAGETKKRLNKNNF